MPEDGCNYKLISFLIWFVYLVVYLPTRYSGASSTQSWFPGQVPNTKALSSTFNTLGTSIQNKDADKCLKYE